MFRSRFFLFSILFLILISLTSIIYFFKNQNNFIPQEPPAPIIAPPPTTAPVFETAVSSSSPDSIEKIKEEMLVQLKEEKSPARALKIPSKRQTKRRVKKSTPKTPAPPNINTPRAQGRKARTLLPLGVILWNRVAVYESATGNKKIYELQTGDFVRVLTDKEKLASNPSRIHIHPGLDVFLLATTKRFEASGEHLPDKSGWVDVSQLQIFSQDGAQEFLMSVEPVTLGPDNSFSTLSFYERAMKNFDPVVHRVIGPRIIALVTLHDDYVTTWSSLIRDHDSKIRAAALSSLKERGLGNNRLLLEDLITRLSELTRIRAQGEQEVEVLTLLNILEDTQHPRVPAALAGFAESWKQTQGNAINEKTQAILKTAEK
jgi:hypothetical protein